MTCTNAKSCCDLGYHTKAEQADPGQTHFYVDCETQGLPLAVWCRYCRAGMELDAPEKPHGLPDNVNEDEGVER